MSVAPPNPSQVPTPVVGPENYRAGRLIGAMFFAVFGGAWLALWGYSEFRPPRLVLSCVGVGTLALFGWACRSYRRSVRAFPGGVDSLEKKKADRVFYLVNAGQWVGIFLAATSLQKLGLAQWTIPAIILIVGVHFLPLAHVFKNRMHYLTGVALILLSMVYPFLTESGPRSSLGCLCTGLILWSSALWPVVQQLARKPGLPPID
jgi:hypothetical protein